tara:strand:- start:408 stop:608 length:201 start_codon:yes stop_codon:yes gene_type:complete
VELESRRDRDFLSQPVVNDTEMPGTALIGDIGGQSQESLLEEVGTVQCRDSDVEMYSLPASRMGAV